MGIIDITGARKLFGKHFVISIKEQRNGSSVTIFQPKMLLRLAFIMITLSYIFSLTAAVDIDLGSIGDTLKELGGKAIEQFKNAQNTMNMNRSLDKIDVKPGRVELKSISKSGQTKSALKFEFATKGIARFRYSYMSRTSDTNAFYKFRTAFFKVVEYNETISTSASTSFIKLLGNSSYWSNITVDEVGNSTVSIKKISTTFTKGSFNLTLTGFVADGVATYEGVELSPTSFKYSVELNNYPYQYENSSLALVQGLYSTSATNLRTSDVQIDNGSFSWNSTIVITKNSSKATSSVSVSAIEAYSGGYSDPEDTGRDTKENVGVMVFKFTAIQPDKVYWDPSLNSNTAALDTATGASNAANTSKSLPSSSSILILSVFVTLVMYFGF